MKLFVALSMATGAWAFTDAREAITEVIDKLNGRGSPPAAVLTLPPPGHNIAGPQMQVRNAGEQGRIPRRRTHGALTSLRTALTMLWLSIPAASAWKLRTTL